MHEFARCSRGVFMKRPKIERLRLVKKYGLKTVGNLNYDTASKRVVVDFVLENFTRPLIVTSLLRNRLAKLE